LKKGSKSERIIFWKLLEIEDQELRKIPFLNYYFVFNISLVEGLNETEDKVKIPGEEFLYSILNKFNIKFRHTFEGEAYYNRSTDEITIPNISCFISLDEYLSTFFHEIAHWCLNKNRIIRPGLNDKKMDYGFEELIAELSACYLYSQKIIRFLIPELFPREENDSTEKKEELVSGYDIVFIS
jgi:antirestriction protein ArdC